MRFPSLTLRPTTTRFWNHLNEKVSSGFSITFRVWGVNSSHETPLTHMLLAKESRAKQNQRPGPWTPNQNISTTLKNGFLLPELTTLQQVLDFKMTIFRSKCFLNGDILVSKKFSAPQNNKRPLFSRRINVTQHHWSQKNLQPTKY